MPKKNHPLGRMPHAIAAPRHILRRFSRELEKFFRAKENSQYPLCNRLARSANRALAQRRRRTMPMSQAL